MTEYYYKLKSLWYDIASIEGVPECNFGAMRSCISNLLKKLIDADSWNKMIHFLVALNESYESIEGIYP